MKRILIIAFATLLVACTEKEPAEHELSVAQGKLVVVTSNYPLYFFTTEIAGNGIEVWFPSIEGDPAMFLGQHLGLGFAKAHRAAFAAALHPVHEIDPDTDQQNER